MIVYYVVTGLKPWKGLFPIDIKSKVLQGDRPSFSKIDLENPLAKIAQKCWSEDPRERMTFDTILEEIQPK